MRDLIKLFESPISMGMGGKKRRCTGAEFIQMARAKYGAKAAKLTLPDLIALGDENGVQVPSEVKLDRNLKVDVHHWNLSGNPGEDVDAKVATDTGEVVDKTVDDAGEEYQDMMRLDKAKTVARLAASGKLYLFGRKPKGAFFRIPGIEELTAQLERMLSRELESKGDSSMVEQYGMLADKVKIVAGGKSSFIKSLLITGGPSSGKSYNVMGTIKELGLTEGKDYIVKKGTISVTSMYRTLIEQMNGLIIFDDCDSVVEDKNGINMLKGALDTDPVREISYDKKGLLNTAALISSDRDRYCEALSNALRYVHTSSDINTLREILTTLGLKNKATKGTTRKESSGGSEFDDEEESFDRDDAGGEEDEEESAILNYVRTHLPNKIEFKGRIIFISNMDESEWDSAILTRAMRQNMNFRSDEMLDFIDSIKDKIKANITEERKQEVMDLIRSLHITGKLKSPINFRLVQQCFDLALVDNWRRIVSQL